jgi:hypothetical protein
MCVANTAFQLCLPHWLVTGANIVQSYDDISSHEGANSTGKGRRSFSHHNSAQKGECCGQLQLRAAGGTLSDILRVLLQDLGAELKAEVRQVLTAAGVDKFVIKPVKRSYAFDLDTVPHGEQWVLKARYSAAKPALALGLTGASLRCLSCAATHPHGTAEHLKAQHPGWPQSGLLISSRMCVSMESFVLP